MATSYSDRNLSLIPAITFSFVENYIKTNKFSSGNKSINKGFKFYSEGYNHNLKVYPKKDGCRVIGKCFKSQRKTEKPHAVEVQFAVSNDEPSVSKAFCVCAIGAQGCCGHVTGLLYQLAQYKTLGNKSLPEDIAKTSLTQTWHTPRGLKISGNEVQNLEVCGYSKKEHDTGDLSKAVKLSLYNPVRGNPPNWFNYHLNVTEIAQDSLILPSLKLAYTAAMVPSKFGQVPAGSVLSYQQKLNEEYIINVFDGVGLSNLPIQNVMAQNYSFASSREQLKLCQNDIKRFEEKTRTQNKSFLWYNVRKHRVTASVVGRIYKRRKDDLSLAKQLQSTRHVTTAGMRRGIAAEPIAAEKYADVSLNAINLYPCGVVVNFWAPWIAASPDRKVYDPTSNPPFGLLEIKCPMVTSVLEASCLNKDTDGSLKLKRNHDYYYQILTQLAVVGLDWFDFFVWGENDYHLETEYFNNVVWDNVKDKVDKFFFTTFI